jgi:hypothetical protein
LFVACVALPPGIRPIGVANKHQKIKARFRGSRRTPRELWEHKVEDKLHLGVWVYEQKKLEYHAILQAALGPKVHSASNRNEYQKQNIEARPVRRADLTANYPDNLGSSTPLSHGPPRRCSPALHTAVRGASPRLMHISTGEKRGHGAHGCDSDDGVVGMATGNIDPRGLTALRHTSTFFGRRLAREQRSAVGMQRP